MLKQRILRSPFLGSEQVVRNNLSPQHTGDEYPFPAIGTFQLKSSAVKVTGTVFAWLIPVPFGPRICTHSWALTGTTIQAASNIHVFMPEEYDDPTH